MKTNEDDQAMTGPDQVTRCPMNTGCKGCRYFECLDKPECLLQIIDSKLDILHDQLTQLQSEVETLQD